MNLQAVHQLHAMVFDGLGADLQDLGDLFGVLAFGDELEDLALPAGQLFERAFPVSNRLRGNFLRSRVEISWRRSTSLTTRCRVVSACSVRVSACSVRISACSVRVFANSVRVSACSVRVSADSARVLACSVRVSACSVRASAFSVRLQPARPGFGLLNPRLVAGHIRRLIIFFHFASITLNRETLQVPWGVHPMCPTPTPFLQPKAGRDLGFIGQAFRLVPYFRVKHGAENDYG